MRDLALNLGSLVMVALTVYWLLIGLQVNGYEIRTRIGWHRCGLFRQSSFVGILMKSVGPVLMWLGPPALVVGALAIFVPSSLAWSFQRWGAWLGVVIAAILALLAFVGTTREERRSEFYAENRDELRPRLGVRQLSYLKPFRDAWEAAQEPPGEEPEEGDDDDFQPRLDFDIVGVTQSQEIADSEPFARDGGNWTVFRCRTKTDPAASFSFAERSGEPKGDTPFAWGEARLWVATAQDGALLAKAIGDAFSVRGGGGETTGGSPSSPLAFNTAVLSRSTHPRRDGGLSGEGSWTATKWFYEETTEFFVNWSPEERVGYFAEKDEEYRLDLHAAFRALVV